jgi:hypothetical protein
MRELLRVISKKRDESDSPGGHSTQIQTPKGKAAAMASSEILREQAGYNE